MASRPDTALRRVLSGIRPNDTDTYPLPGLYADGYSSTLNARYPDFVFRQRKYQGPDAKPDTPWEAEAWRKRPRVLITVRRRTLGE
jgi:hypothetical protein